MKLDNIKVGLCITGSFCNFDRTKEVIDLLKSKNIEVTAIISEIVKNTSTRFYKKNEYIDMLEERTGNRILDSIEKTEPIGPKEMFDVLLILPCTGNTLGKISNGISDTSVTMAVKSHIRNNRRVVVGISTNDGLGKNLKNIGDLLNTKNFYFIPFFQDDYIKKPKSLVLDYDKIIDTLEYALDNKQIDPIISKK